MVADIMGAINWLWKNGLFLICSRMTGYIRFVAVRFVEGGTLPRSRSLLHLGSRTKLRIAAAQRVHEFRRFVILIIDKCVVYAQLHMTRVSNRRASGG